MSSDSVEEYLEAIHFFNEKGEIARNTDLSKRLKVAPPSVTQMIKKLANEGLVEYEPYKGTVLTGKGMAKAQKVVRRHRILERFLHDFLGLKDEKVHEEACRMEHSLSDETALAMCKALENPKTCPDDGMEIPQCPLGISECDECESVREEGARRLVTELSNLKPGEKGTVHFMRGHTGACQRLLDMGLTRGTEIEVINSAPFRGPVEIKVRGTCLALGRGLASKVFVEVEDGLRERLHPHGPHH